MTTTTDHGARPVPLPNALPTFAAVTAVDGQDNLHPIELPAPIPALPDDHGAIHGLARLPIRPAAVVPVVGCEGGAGRTTVTRLLAEMFREIRGEHAFVVDAVPMWGGMTASADQRGEYSAADVAAMPWPVSREELVRSLASARGVPILPSPAPTRGLVCDPVDLLAAVERLASIAPMTFVDTVADVASSPSRDLVSDPSSTVVWVASATRSGVWGIAEALVYFRALGAEQIARRSIAAVVGGRRRWPADAAAAEAQLAGLGVATVRIPHSRTPLADARCRNAAERLLAAVVTRSG